LVVGSLKSQAHAIAMRPGRPPTDSIRATHRRNVARGSSCSPIRLTRNGATWNSTRPQARWHRADDRAGMRQIMNQSSQSLAWSWIKQLARWRRSTCSASCMRPRRRRAV